MRRREGLRTALGYACAWSVQQLTGEAIGEIPPLVEIQRDWLLSPFDRESRVQGAHGSSTSPRIAVETTP